MEYTPAVTNPNPKQETPQNKRDHCKKDGQCVWGSIGRVQHHGLTVEASGGHAFAHPAQWGPGARGVVRV